MFIVAKNREIDCCVSLVDCCLMETIIRGLGRVCCNRGSVAVVVSCRLRTRDYFNESSWSIDWHCLILDPLIVAKGERTQVPFHIFVERTSNYFNERSWSIDQHCLIFDRLIVAKGLKFSSISLSRLFLLHWNAKIWLEEVNQLIDWFGYGNYGQKSVQLIAMQEFLNCLLLKYSRRRDKLHKIVIIYNWFIHRDDSYSLDIVGIPLFVWSQEGPTASHL